MANNKFRWQHFSKIWLHNVNIVNKNAACNASHKSEFYYLLYKINTPFFHFREEENFQVVSSTYCKKNTN